MNVSKGIDSYRLKLTALIFMLPDHICSELNVPAHTRLGCPLWPQWIPVITRFVSPLFLYLMVEGFYHTRSRIKYLRRRILPGTAGIYLLVLPQQQTFAVRRNRHMESCPVSSCAYLIFGFGNIALHSLML
ncbi:MAG: hypothetical protein K6F49_03155 [Saccharofermentans sp.]|nr:hypothetical protein [Saccharofermentans sp.]